jgi:hypothetical protein
MLWSQFSAIFGDFRRFSAIFGDFRRFSPIFDEKPGVLLHSQCLYVPKIPERRGKQIIASSS